MFPTGTKTPCLFFTAISKIYYKAVAHLSWVLVYVFARQKWSNHLAARGRFINHPISFCGSQDEAFSAHRRAAKDDTEILFQPIS